MLILLQERARELGIDLSLKPNSTASRSYRKDYDLVVATDGINSRVRNEYADVFRPDIDMRECKFVWLGTHQKFDDAFTFIFEKTRHGWVWAHAYQFDDRHGDLHRRDAAGHLGAFRFEDMSKEEAVETCRKIFEPHLGGHALISTPHLRGSAVWMKFPRVLCEKWHHENVVLMGDAAATGHFSIGSGTRLAFDSAIALATTCIPSRHGRPPSTAIRMSAGSRCCGCSLRRATALNGSNRSSATSTSTRCSSTIRC
jgi:anthraniloyl-CoA monooxygenase